jgi:hypothetical protein
MRTAIALPFVLFASSAAVAGDEVNTRSTVTPWARIKAT